MRIKVMATLVGLTLVATGVGAWQRPADATRMSKAEIDAVFETIGRSVDKQVKVADIGNGINVAVGILHRLEMSSDEGEVQAMVHHDVAEVYYVVSGSATLVNGGSLSDTREFPPQSGVVTELVGPSGMGTSQAGESRAVGPGDVVIIPIGVPHGFSRIDEAITYLSIRVDPDQVLPAGYVNPVIR